MQNIEYQRLGKKYGKGVYELLSYFKSIKVYRREEDGYHYVRTLIAYPHAKINFKDPSKTVIEMIDIESGKVYPAIDASNSVDLESGTLGYCVNDVLDINENLFDIEQEEDNNGKSTTPYDIYDFERIIRLMKNFVVTTYSLTKIESFQKIALTPIEIDHQKRRKIIRDHAKEFSSIKIARISSILSMESGKYRRKSKLRWYSVADNIPVYIDENEKYAIDLRDGITKYDILEYVPVENNRKLFAHFSRAVEITDEQYDLIYDRFLNDQDKHYYIQGMGSVDHYKPIYFNAKQTEEILNNYIKVVEQEKTKDSSKKYQKK